MSAAEVPVAHQDDDGILGEGALDGGTGLGVEGDDLDPVAAPELPKPLEQLGGFKYLHDGGHRVADDATDPEPGPVPAPEVRQGEDHPATGLPGLDDMLEAVLREAGADLIGCRPGSRRLWNQ